MKKAIGYVRVAGGQNPELALEGQKKRISEYAEKNGYEVIGWEEDVCSGLNLDRPALKRVLDRAKEGQFEAVLATKLDILARNDSLFRVIELLGDSGVVLDFVSDDGALLELHNAFRRLAGV